MASSLALDRVNNVKIEELLLMLPQMNEVSHQFSESQLSEMWNFAIDSMLVKCHPGMGDFKDEIEKIVEMIISCPQLDYLNMSSIEQYFIRLNRQDLIQRFQIPALQNGTSTTT